MELYCKIRQGLEPDLLDRLSRLFEADPAIRTAQICLTDPRSRRQVPTSDLARIFATIVSNLAEGRGIALLFENDLREVEKKLRSLRMEGKREGHRSLWVELPPPNLEGLSETLRLCAFTTFYGWVSSIDLAGDRSLPKGASFRQAVRNLDEAYFLSVFTLYDESMELLSKAIPSEFIISAVREVGAAEGLRVMC